MLFSLMLLESLLTMSLITKSCVCILIISARIFNIYPRKGAILPGSDADIIILNPNSSYEISSKSHHSRSDTNVYEGRRGKVIHIFTNPLFWYV